MNTRKNQNPEQLETPTVFTQPKYALRHFDICVLFAVAYMRYIQTIESHNKAPLLNTSESPHRSRDWKHS